MANLIVTMIVQPPHTLQVMSLFLMLPKWCFHPDPLTQFGSMSLNMKFFFFEGVPKSDGLPNTDPMFILLHDW